MSIAAAIIAIAALYISCAAVIYTRASVHSRRAVALYATRRIQDGDAEAQRGRTMKRRADKLLLQHPAS